MEVIVKFFENDDPKTDNTVISRTLGKIALIARKKAATLTPQPQEFWRVRVVQELQRGKPSGCFLVQPIKKVEIDELLHLAPGMYTSTHENGRMIVRPNAEYQDRACILPLDHKHVFAKDKGTYCTLVDVSRQVTPTQVTKVRRNNPYG